jgi:hypothetical protein
MNDRKTNRQEERKSSQRTPFENFFVLLRVLRGKWFLLLPLFLFIPGLSGFPYPSPAALYSDITISHYPNAIFFRRALLEYGQIPLWSPQILSGYPFAANPLSGLWYPPGWLAFLLPLPLGFNFLVIVHLLWGGLGMTRLLQSEGIKPPAALLGAVTFVAMPKLFAHYGAGHLTLLYAIPWTPWLLLARRRWQSAPVLALIFLADPRWAAYAGLLWFAYSQFWVAPLNMVNAPKNKSVFIRVYQRLKNSLLQIAVAAMLAAPLALPLLEYTRLSTRANLARADIFTQSLPPARLLGLLFPAFGGSHEWMLYFGAGALVLGLAALIFRVGRFWGWVFAAALLFSLGENLPLLPALARIPGFDLLRVPPRALFIGGIAAAALSAHAVDHLLRGNLDVTRVRRLVLALTGLCAFSGMLVLGIGRLTGQWALNFLWGMGALWVVSLWVLAGLRSWLPAPAWTVGLLFLVILDTGAVNASVLSFRPADAVIPNPAAEFLAAQSGDFRIYSPSYSLPQQSAAFYDLSLADGVDPLQLRVYAEFMAQASGVPADGYSITVPPFVADAPARANANFMPDAAQLGLLNVRYVAAEFDLSAAGLKLVAQFDETRIYENALALPPAWIDRADGRANTELMAYTPNRIEVRAVGPGWLILSEMNYPGWQVWVDGERAELEAYADVLRAVSLEAGEHNVRFVYRPLSVYLGVLICAIGLLVMAKFRYEEARKV